MREIETFHNCTLEWHKERGVIYVHNNETGQTLLRVCRLQKSNASLHDGTIDVTNKVGASMPERDEGDLIYPGINEPPKGS